MINRRSLWSEKGEPEKAIQDFDEAVRLDPNATVAFYNRGHVWIAKGNYGKAISDFTEVLRQSPEFVEAYYYRGLAALGARNWKSASSDMDKVIHASPMHVEALVAKAQIQSSCPDKAYRDGKEAVMNAKIACIWTGWKNSTYIDVLACAHAEAGDFESAVKWIEMALGDSNYSKQNGPEAKRRLKMFREGKPFRIGLE